MDAESFDRLVRAWVRPGTRRRLLGLLGGLPLVGILRLTSDELEVDARGGGRNHRHRGRHKRHDQHHRRKHRVEAQKKKKKKKNKTSPPPPLSPSPPSPPPSPPPPPTCLPQPQETTCAGKCATVTNNCGTVVDCGPCACAATCAQCQRCNATTGQCENLGDGTACDDGDACTQTDSCQSGTCVGSNPKTCTASDQCHDAGSCDPATGQCSNPAKPDGTVCNDGNPCTTGEACLSGVCTGGTPISCPPASDQCHDVGVCDPSSGICSNPAKANGTPCNDSNACTTGETCQNGACTGGTATVCTALDQCHVAGTCNPSTGLCSNPAKADGAACDDGDQCTVDDTCQSGTCVPGTVVTCTALSQCHDAGTCNPATGTCSNPTKADGTSCDDGDACTQNDVCQSGDCAGTAVICDAPTTCHTATGATCNTTTGQCSYPNEPNGTSCGGSSVCCNGACCPGCCDSNGTCGSCTVFVTSTTHDGDLGGLTGADAICQARATAASLPGTYKAWLSTGGGLNESPATGRFRQSTMPYRLVGGDQIASNWTSLTDGSLDRTIVLSETGTFVGNTEQVWTNTSAFGMVGNGNDCGDWSSPSPGNSGQVGITGQPSSNWTASGNINCGAAARLYCFQQQ